MLTQRRIKTPPTVSSAQPCWRLVFIFSRRRSRKLLKAGVVASLVWFRRCQITYPEVRVEVLGAGMVLHYKRCVINWVDGPGKYITGSPLLCFEPFSCFSPHSRPALSLSSETEQFNLKLWVIHILTYFGSRDELWSLVQLFELCKVMFFPAALGLGAAEMGLLGEATFLAKKEETAICKASLSARLRGNAVRSPL